MRDGAAGAVAAPDRAAQAARRGQGRSGPWPWLWLLPAVDDNVGPYLGRGGCPRISTVHRGYVRFRASRTQVYAHRDAAARSQANSASRRAHAQGAASGRPTSPRAIEPTHAAPSRRKDGRGGPGSGQILSGARNVVRRSSRGPGVARRRSSARCRAARQRTGSGGRSHLRPARTPTPVQPGAVELAPIEPWTRPYREPFVTRHDLERADAAALAPPALPLEGHAEAS